MRSIRKRMFILPAALTLCVVASGQDPSAAQNPDRTTQTEDPGNRSPRYGSHSSESYGGRAEVFVTGFWSFTNNSNQGSIAHTATESGGFSGGYRFHLNSWSALEGRYGFNNDSQKYDLSGSTSSIPTYLSEITGSYVYKFPRLRRFHPFLEAGGGIVHLSPGHYGNTVNPSGVNSAGSSGSGATVSGPGPYAVLGSGASVTMPGYSTPRTDFVSQTTLVSTAVYSSASSGVASQTRGAFVYGGGLDFNASNHLLLRLEFRGLAFKAADFGLSALRTNAFDFVSEPSIGIGYRF